jgi:thioredoxin-related protein
MSKKVKIISAISLCILAIWGVLQMHQQRDNFASKYPNTRSEKLPQLVSKAVNQSGQSILVFHKTGCSDCRHAQKQVLKSLKILHSKHSKVNVIVMDYKEPATHHFFSKFKVTNTPTFIEIKNQEEVRRYSGTDNVQIKRLIELQ